MIAEAGEVPKLRTVTGKHNLDETVTVDGMRFVNCKFTRCTLRYSGGPFAFENSSGDDYTRYRFDGAASFTYRFLKNAGFIRPDILDPSAPLPKLKQN